MSRHCEEPKATKQSLQVEPFFMFDLGAREKPILKWAGGKSGLLPQLLPRFPRGFKRYLEPFFGGGAVFFSLQPGVRAIVNDSNRELIDLYEAIRDTPEELMAELDRLARRYCEGFYYELRASGPGSRVARAARTLFLNKTGYNGLYRQNSKGGFNVPFGKRRRCPALYERANLLRVSERLAQAELVHGDFEAILRRARRGDFVYCDPPYEPLSTTSSFNCYLASGFTWREQVRLRDAAEKAARRGAVVMISNSSAPLIPHLYGDWPMHRISARREINSKASGRGEIAELCIVLG